MFLCFLTCDSCGLKHVLDGVFWFSPLWLRVEYKKLEHLNFIPTLFTGVSCFLLYFGTSKNCGFFTKRNILTLEIFPQTVNCWGCYSFQKGRDMNIPCKSLKIHHKNQTDFLPTSQTMLIVNSFIAHPISKNSNPKPTSKKSRQKKQKQTKSPPDFCCNDVCFLGGKNTKP